MYRAVKRIIQTGLVGLVSLGNLASAEPPALPEEHFPALQSLLGTSANRKLSRDLREAEARARQKAADAYGRTRAFAGAYGAYILEHREGESLDSRARFTWELGAERTLFEFYDAVDARRGLGAQEARMISWSERQEEAAWLKDVRALFINRLVAAQAAQLRGETLQAAQDELATLKALSEEGRLAELDVLEAEIAVVEIEERYTLSLKRVALIEESLERYTGLTELPSITPDSLLRLAQSDFETLADRTLEFPLTRAPTIERLEAEIERADAQRRISASESMPRVSAWTRVFQDELQGPEFSGTVNRTNYEAVLGVRWNFWDSGRSRSLARAEQLKGQRLEKTRDRHYSEFQKNARDLEYHYESARSDVKIKDASKTLRKRVFDAQKKAASTDASLLPQALSARIAASEAGTSLMEAYAEAWKARTAWLLYVYGDPFVER